MIGKAIGFVIIMMTKIQEPSTNEIEATTQVPIKSWHFWTLHSLDSK